MTEVLKLCGLKDGVEAQTLAAHGSENALNYWGEHAASVEPRCACADCVTHRNPTEMWHICEPNDMRGVIHGRLLYRTSG